MKTPNKKMIGIFLIVGIIAFGVLIGRFAMRYLDTGNKYIAVMYFDESIKGLNVGSPVVFNGVEIGKVTQIELLGDPQNMTFSVPVYVQLTPLKRMQGVTSQFFHRQRMLEDLIDKGLRARLSTQSYLTGQLMIELTMIPNAPLNMKNEERDAKRDLPEIPTVLSPAGELSQGLQDLPIRQTVDKLEQILNIFQEQLPVILPALAKTVQNLEQMTGNIAPQTDGFIRQANKTLYDVSDAARSLRNFADYIERHPESLLTGKKGN